MFDRVAWMRRLEAEYRAYNFTAQQKRVLVTIPSFKGPSGIIPSHKAIAYKARCSVKTVRRTLEIARTLGLLEWVHRYHRVGQYKVRTSNLYVLIVPDRPVIPNARRVYADHPPKGLKGHVQKESVKSKGLLGVNILDARPPVLTPEQQIAFCLAGAAEQAAVVRSHRRYWQSDHPPP